MFKYIDNYNILKQMIPKKAIKFLVDLGFSKKHWLKKLITNSIHSNK